MTIVFKFYSLFNFLISTISHQATQDIGRGDRNFKPNKLLDTRVLDIIFSFFLSPYFEGHIMNSRLDNNSPCYEDLELFYGEEEIVFAQGQQTRNMNISF